MAEDWAADVKKYVPDADDTVIAAIVRYCGIALRNRDSSLVSFTDAKETGRVRDNFCRKKLGLTDSDEEIDAAIQAVGKRMSGDPTRNRVTVYYLLAESFGKLGLFGGAAGSSASGTVAAAAAAVPLAAMAATPAQADSGSASGARHSAGLAARDPGALGCGFFLAVLGGLLLIIAGTMLLGDWMVNRNKGEPVAAAAPAEVATPTPVAPAPAPVIPEGSGVLAEEVEGRPKVSVYFDTGKTDVTPDFATVAAPIKAWLEAHPGDRLAVSGFNDPTGNAALNAELSKNRAKAVAASLAGIGVPADVIDLEKPPETTDTNVDMAQARRVEITVKPAG
jgi:outer membrane protein OmpA-like peptidoglycan-associated protein